MIRRALAILALIAAYVLAGARVYGTDTDGRVGAQYPDKEQAVYSKFAGDDVTIKDLVVHDCTNQKAVNIVGNWKSLTVQNCQISNIFRDATVLAALEAAQPARMQGLLGGAKNAAGQWVYGSLHIDYLRITGQQGLPAGGSTITLKDDVIDAPLPPGMTGAASDTKTNALIGLIKDLNVAKLTVDHVTIPRQAGSTFQVYNSANCFVGAVEFKNGCTGTWSFQNGGGRDCDIVVTNCPGLSVQLWTAGPGGHPWGGRIVVDGKPIAGNLTAGPHVNVAVPPAVVPDDFTGGALFRANHDPIYFKSDGRGTWQLSGAYAGVNLMFSPTATGPADYWKNEYDTLSAAATAKIAALQADIDAQAAALATEKATSADLTGRLSAIRKDAGSP